MKDKFPDKLLANLKSHRPQLRKLLRETNSHWCYEDSVHRFYHMSFKVYRLQYKTSKIAEALAKVAPKGFIFCSTFQDLIKKGAGNKQWKLSHNKNWNKHTRIFLEAFFHAKYFLEMAVKYGKKFDKAPTIMPSGWAALLSLYQREKDNSLWYNC
jgi:hypothetical protein